MEKRSLPCPPAARTSTRTRASFIAAICTTPSLGHSGNPGLVLWRVGGVGAQRRRGRARWAARLRPRRNGAASSMGTSSYDRLDGTRVFGGELRAAHRRQVVPARGGGRRCRAANSGRHPGDFELGKHFVVLVRYGGGVGTSFWSPARWRTDRAPAAAVTLPNAGACQGGCPNRGGTARATLAILGSRRTVVIASAVEIAVVLRSYGATSRVFKGFESFDFRGK